MIDRIGRESSLDCLPIDGATLTKMQRLDYFYIWRAEKRVVLAFDHLRKMPKYGVYGKLVWGEESIYMYVVCMRVEAEKETEKEWKDSSVTSSLMLYDFSTMHVGHISAADQLSLFVNTNKTFILFNISEFTKTDNRSAADM